MRMVRRTRKMKMPMMAPISLTSFFRFFLQCFSQSYAMAVLGDEENEEEEEEEREKRKWSLCELTSGYEEESHVVVKENGWYLYFIYTVHFQPGPTTTIYFQTHQNCSKNISLNYKSNLCPV